MGIKNKLHVLAKSIPALARAPFAFSSWSLKKPRALTWAQYRRISNIPIRYQPLVFPDGRVIEKNSDASVIDSREKLDALHIPGNMSGKTFMDIGCAEGFFVIQAALRGADHARGCDMTPERIRLAQTVAKTWDFGDRVEFANTALYEIPAEWAADIVTCLAVCHHLHGGDHDTWRIVSHPDQHRRAYDNMLQAVRAVAGLTRECTIWEYCYEYDGPKPDNVDYERLARTWTQNGIYREVNFIGLSQETPEKDRAIYHAVK